LNRCYEHALEAAGKKFTAKMVAKILISTSGAASKVAFSEAQGMTPALKACLAKHIKSWEFPKVPSEAWFTYPLVFEPAY
ncbi:MAG: AgmX/PglI C-terminal domain-containing protein, partial [Deltaproteobacteria bacterium]|nr:AgmX/PglI C-terminal domain-containing protein [Deltaproteobacteria bacterium]